jgi:hypothetical protein
VCPWQLFGYLNLSEMEVKIQEQKQNVHWGRVSDGGLNSNPYPLQLGIRCAFTRQLDQASCYHSHLHDSFSCFCKPRVGHPHCLFNSINNSNIRSCSSRSVKRSPPGMKFQYSLWELMQRDIYLHIEMLMYAVTIQGCTLALTSAMPHIWRV